MIWRFVTKYPFIFEGYLQRARDRGFVSPFFRDGMGTEWGNLKSKGKKAMGKGGLLGHIYISIDCRIFQLELGNQHIIHIQGRGEGGKKENGKKGGEISLVLNELIRMGARREKIMIHKS